MKRAVYLCGPILHRTDDECVAWRETATALLAPIPTLNPIRRDYRGKEKQQQETETAAQIVKYDLDDIDNSCCILVMYDKPSIGTSMEIRYAAAERRIPVYVVNISGAKELSPWLIHHTTNFFTSLADACKYIHQVHFIEHWNMGAPVSL